MDGKICQNIKPHKTPFLHLLFMLIVFFLNKTKFNYF